MALAPLGVRALGLAPSHVPMEGNQLAATAAMAALPTRRRRRRALPGSPRRTCVQVLVTFPA